MASYSYCTASYIVNCHIPTCLTYVPSTNSSYVWTDPNVHDLNDEVCKKRNLYMNAVKKCVKW